MADKTPPKPDPKTAREARLAAALRANLRKRKAPAPDAKPQKAEKKD